MFVERIRVGLASGRTEVVVSGGGLVCDQFAGVVIYKSLPLPQYSFILRCVHYLQIAAVPQAWHRRVSSRFFPF